MRKGRCHATHGTGQASRCQKCTLTQTQLGVGSDTAWMWRQNRSSGQNCTRNQPQEKDALRAFVHAVNLPWQQAIPIPMMKLPLPYRARSFQFFQQAADDKDAVHSLDSMP